METNRIDFFFGLAGNNPATKAAEGGGFADLLFGVMSKRSDRAAAEPAQIRAAPSLALQPLSATHVIDTHQRDDDADNAHDRRVDHDRTAAVRKSDNARAAKSREEVGNHPCGPRHLDKKAAAGTRGACHEQQAHETDRVDPGMPIQAISEAKPSDEGPGLAFDAVEEDGAGNDESADQQPDPQAGLAITACVVAVDETVTATAIAGESAAEVEMSVVTRTAAASPAETGQAADLTAAATLSDIGGIATQSESNSTTPGSVAAPDTGENSAPDEAQSTLTFAASVALTEASELDATEARAQTAAIAAAGERRLEDSSNFFPRNGANGRKTTPIGPGTTAATHAGQQFNGAQTTPELEAAVTSPNSGDLASGAAAPIGAAPVGFDTGLGAQSGLPGWNLHLAQGSAVRRSDFVASLRQHLQNLPLHDQVALSIQRSLRDGGGSITLQLSPTELGRIHLKLNIDEENNVQASVMVERPATLELLQRDMKALERALQEAGLKAGPGDLSFSLQGGDPEAFARDFGSGSGSGPGGTGQANDEGAEELTTSAAAAVIATGDGWVDVQV